MAGRLRYKKNVIVRRHDFQKVMLLAAFTWVYQRKWVCLHQLLYHLSRNCTRNPQPWNHATSNKRQAASRAKQNFQMWFLAGLVTCPCRLPNPYTSSIGLWTIKQLVIILSRFQPRHIIYQISDSKYQTSDPNIKKQIMKYQIPKNQILISDMTFALREVDLLIYSQSYSSFPIADVVCNCMRIKCKSTYLFNCRWFLQRSMLRDKST